MRTGRCRSCGAAIGWTMTERGKRMPVDIDPRPAVQGFRVLEGPEYGDGQTPVAQFVPQAAGGERLYQSHFATCPQGAQHRRPR